MADAPAKLCKGCVFFDFKAQECHRYAPRPVILDEQKKMRWPATPPIGWCGEFVDKNAPEPAVAEAAPAPVPAIPAPAPAAKPATAPATPAAKPATPAAPVPKPAPPAK